MHAVAWLPFAHWPHLRALLGGGLSCCSECINYCRLADSIALSVVVHLPRPYRDCMHPCESHARTWGARFTAQPAAGRDPMVEYGINVRPDDERRPTQIRAELPGV